MKRSISIPTTHDYVYWGSYEYDAEEEIVHLFNEFGDHIVTVPVSIDGPEATARRELVRYDASRREREGFGRRLCYPKHFCPY
jgi:hypothetical protein